MLCNITINNTMKYFDENIVIMKDYDKIFQNIYRS